MSAIARPGVGTDENPVDPETSNGSATRFHASRQVFHGQLELDATLQIASEEFDRTISMKRMFVNISSPKTPGKVFLNPPHSGIFRRKQNTAKRGTAHDCVLGRNQ